MAAECEGVLCGSRMGKIGGLGDPPVRPVDFSSMLQQRRVACGGPGVGNLLIFGEAQMQVEGKGRQPF